MENTDVLLNQTNITSEQSLLKLVEEISSESTSSENEKVSVPEILFISLYPPDESGVSAYSRDLLKVLSKKFSNSFSLKVCAIETVTKKHKYPSEVKYLLNPACVESYTELANLINGTDQTCLVILQYESAIFENKEQYLIQFLSSLTKPVATVIHSITSTPTAYIKETVQQIASMSDAIVVMTDYSGNVLISEYDLRKNKIIVIPYGTHLVKHMDKDLLKNKYGLKNRKVLSTFGFLNSAKNIEITLDALPYIIKTSPDVMFLIIGKTHSSVLAEEGETYRSKLETKVIELELQNNVRFINYYLPLDSLLEYLQLTDIYLFTSNDTSKVLNETLSYAMSCGCSIISTPVPYASEILSGNSGILVNFENPKMLSETISRLLFDERLRKNISMAALRKTAKVAWENIAIQYVALYKKLINDKITLNYNLPEINFSHFQKMTTSFGMLQLADMNQPDINSGYTLNNNAMALITQCRRYELDRHESDIEYIKIYFNFIKHCLQSEGYFLNYVDYKGSFTLQNNTCNLADANGKAIWALGYLVSMRNILPTELTEAADAIIRQVLFKINTLHSTRAMAFTIKGLYYYNIEKKSGEISAIIKGLANRLVQMYKRTSEKGWEWFESYMAYNNGVLPEALLYAYSATGEYLYKDIAKTSFDFLLLHNFNSDNSLVSRNQKTLNTEEASRQQMQPLDLSYTILALGSFYDQFNSGEYLQKMENAFNWFLGNNHLNKVIYNPCTGGCYDSVDERGADLNQSSASTINYLLSRLTMETYFNKSQNVRAATESVKKQQIILSEVPPQPPAQKQVA
ncbi:MAG TPA: glycosyltransferase [Bacteroidia bacterium]|jgi:glycosyltransferase involved in cell wall biosynthesis|nr:glycosyltransferase [Bacteroidia bacterium]